MGGAREADRERGSEKASGGEDSEMRTELEVRMENYCGPAHEALLRFNRQRDDTPTLSPRRFPGS